MLAYQRPSTPFRQRLEEPRTPPGHPPPGLQSGVRLSWPCPRNTKHFPERPPQKNVHTGDDYYPRPYMGPEAVIEGAPPGGVLDPRQCRSLDAASWWPRAERSTPSTMHDR